MKKIKVYETTIHRDMTEGRGGMEHLGYFTREGDAERAGEPHKIMGVAKGHSVTEKELVIYEAFREYLLQKDSELYNSIIKKLSEEELAVLGLNK